MRKERNNERTVNERRENRRNEGILETEKKGRERSKREQWGD